MSARRIGVVIALGTTLAATVTANACGGKNFTPQSDPAEGGSPSDGGSDGGGVAGSSTGGNAGNAAGSGKGGKSGASTGGTGAGGEGEGGAGGEPSCSEGATCPSGRYCDAQGACRPCSDISTLDDPAAAEFGTPEPLTAINDAAGDWFLRTPRALGTTGALLYVKDFFGGEIWLSGDPMNDIGAPLPTPINQPDYLEGSPLWLSFDGAFDSYNFIFNRDLTTDAVAANELHAATIALNGTTAEVTPLPAPYNPTQPLTQSMYAMAVSRERAWWMVNRDLMLGVSFYTAPLDQAGPPSVVPLAYPEGCNHFEFDVGAWVTPDGRLLFASATERTPDCAALSGEPRDVVMFQLDEGGQARGPGIPVTGVSRPETHEIDGSLTPDMCTLYFVTWVDDKLRVMRSRRER